MKKLLAMVLALVMTLSLAVSASAFKDDKDISADYAEAVAVLDGMGVFKGYEDGSFQPQGNITRAEVAAIVRQSLDRLPELTREVFVARRFEELSYKEIAEKYGITVRRVEFELEKAVKQLRVALKDYLPVLLMLLSDNILRS